MTNMIYTVLHDKYDIYYMTNYKNIKSYKLLLPMAATLTINTPGTGHIGVQIIIKLFSVLGSNFDYLGFLTSQVYAH